MCVILADDNFFIRDGLAAMLRAAGFDVIAQASNPDELIDAFTHDPPDVCVIDIKMPPTHTTEGLTAAITIRQQRPRTGILLLSQHIETHYLDQLLDNSAAGVGYLLKDRLANLREITDALHQISAGGSVIDPEVISRLIKRHRTDNPIDKLTDRQQQILGLIAEGKSNQAIGRQLFLTSSRLAGVVAR